MHFKKRFNFSIFILIYLFVTFILVPLIINISFKNTAPYSFLSSEWNASDSLLYFGSVISGLGTVLLGLITVSQTQKINKKSMEHENANTKRPFFVINDILCQNKDENKFVFGQNGFKYRYNSSQYVFVRIINIGDGVANNLLIEPWVQSGLAKEARPCFCINNDSFCTIPVYLPDNINEKKIFYTEIQYENLIGYAYSQKIELMIIPSSVDKDSDQYSYEAMIFNIHPQILLGMHKYDNKYGCYKIK